MGQIYYSSFSRNKRGVAILINKNTPFTLEKCVKDCEDQYVVITGFLHGEHMMIGCVYAPNVYQEEFYSKLIADTSGVSVAFSILGGDFNCVMNSEVDQSPMTKATSKMRELCVDLQLFDAWRTIHPRGKDYIFVSHPHQSFSRIDYFFVSRTVLDRMEDCTIGSRLLSDHADVSIMISPPSPQPTPRHW